MSEFRQVYTRMWKDGWFIDLEPSERLLWIYLFTNERASVAGIYELPLKVIIFETGLDKEFVITTMAKFTACGKMFYGDGVIWLTKMLRYQASRSPKIATRIIADINAVPDCEVKRRYLEAFDAKEYSIDTLSIRTPKNDSEKEKREEKDTDTEKEKVEEGKTSGSAVSASTSPSLVIFGSYPIPETPLEAERHPALALFRGVTGGTYPPKTEYRTVIETLDILASRIGYDPPLLLENYLKPYWLAWKGRKRANGHPYDRRNLAWLTEWALSGEIPPANGAGNQPVGPPGSVSVDYEAEVKAKAQAAREMMQNATRFTADGKPKQSSP